jgi:acetoin utilization deacetylase AcuC-like enzyme
MLPFKLIYDERFRLPLGQHIFHADKYQRVFERLIAHGAATREDFVSAPPASDEDILLVHTFHWVDKLRTGMLTVREELELEVPYSAELVDAFWQIAGNSIAAADYALRDGCAINIGGGFHHAFPDHGEGFCVVNDIAVAIRAMQRAGKIARALVVDLDVHQGNGTAAIFGTGEPEPFPRPAWSAGLTGPNRPAHMKYSAAKEVFTVSMHQESNYPYWKPASSIDVNLPDGIDDDEYLEWLHKALRSSRERFEPELISYVAGADPFEHDQLGGLGLTVEGLKQRDKIVFEFARDLGCPVMATFAGGYAEEIEDTVTIHTNTVLAAKEVFA